MKEALALHDLNFNVFALEEGGKRPLGAWRHLQEKRLTRGQLQAIFERSHNVGIICGELQETGVNVLGVDCDTEEVFRQISGELPESPMVAKTARGFHLYYRLSLGSPVPNRAHVGGRPLDLRGQGGYLVAPPSVNRASGARYEWVRGPVDARELPEFPEGFLPKEQPNTAAVRTAPSDRDTLAAARHYLTTAGPAVSGEGGHKKTFRLACKLVHPHPVGFGLTYAEALELMQWWNPMNCPPWSEKELTHKLLDAIKCAR